MSPRAPSKRPARTGAGRGLAGLKTRVKSGEMAVAFALYPTQMRDLMAVADAGGMVNHVLDWSV